VNIWVVGARPRTLPAAVAPVVVGTACASGLTDIVWWRAGAAMVVSLALQVAVNYANDYSDGVRGTDAQRIGPARLVAGGLASATAVKRAAFAAFAVAGAAGVALSIAVGPELVAVGAASIVAAWCYTGGPKPYGYYGFGELFVFVFFGLVATVGSSYVQLEHLTGLAVVASVPVGFAACSLLVVNNLRDIPTDTIAGKKTLAVRVGDRATRRLYATLMIGSVLVGTACGLVRPGALAVVMVGLLVAGPVAVVLHGAKGRALIAVLGATARVQLALALVLSVGLWLT
jgi:1,4-dihydroxy-2-naphthoate polyprenyltransferase